MDYALRLSLLSLSLGCGAAVEDSETSPEGSSTTAGNEATTSASGAPTIATSNATSSGSEPTSGVITTQATTGVDSTATFATGPDESGGSSSAGFEVCPDQPGGGAEGGESCVGNSDCVSGLCLLARDVPVDASAVCGGVPAGCRTRFTGSVRDLVTQVPLAGDIVLLGALDVLTVPLNAEPEGVGSSDAAGAYDFLSDEALTASIAAVGLFVGSEPYVTTGVLLAGPVGRGLYPVGANAHELWPIHRADLEAWSDALVGQVDPEVLPLGDGGAIVGFVRDADGDRVEGATVEPVTNGSIAEVFYPHADGSVAAPATDETGLFVVVRSSGTLEEYQAAGSGLSGASGSLSAPQVVFAMVITIE